MTTGWSSMRSQEKDKRWGYTTHTEVVFRLITEQFEPWLNCLMLTHFHCRTQLIINTHTHTCAVYMLRHSFTHRGPHGQTIAWILQVWNKPVPLLAEQSDSLSSIVICHVLINEQRLSSICPINQAFGQWSIPSVAIINHSAVGDYFSHPLSPSS